MPVRNSHVLAILLGGMAAVATNMGVSASDAPLQNALQKSGCKTPSIKQLLQRGDVTVFEANCSQSSHRVITVTCTKQTCRVEEPAREEDRSGRGGMPLAEEDHPQRGMLQSITYRPTRADDAD